MKVLLVDPPHDAFLGFYRFYFPMGLVSVGTVLHDDGHDVLIFDGDHLPEGRSLSNVASSRLWDQYYEGVENHDHPTWQRLRGMLEEHQPDVVGLTVLSCKLPSALSAIRLVKQTLPGAKVIVGGDHVAYYGKATAANPDIDVVVMGEGEEPAKELVRALETGRSLESIRGIAVCENGDTTASRRPLIQNLDSLGIPRRQLLAGIETYEPRDMGLMMTSRGCPSRCSFCGIAATLGRTARFRSIDICMEEIADTRQAFGTTYFSFRDGTFTVDRDRTVEFCRALLERRLDVQWECLTRPDCLDQELVELMQEAGCVQVRLGLESGSPAMLEYMRKEATIETYERAARILAHCDMFWSAYLMFGLPEETMDDMRMTLDLVERLRPDFITVSRYVPLPGTPMFKDVLAMGHDVNWLQQNNRCYDQSYTRHVSADRFRRFMEDIGDFAQDYNRRRSRERNRSDRRLADGFEHAIPPSVPTHDWSAPDTIRPSS